MLLRYCDRWKELVANESVIGDPKTIVVVKDVVGIDCRRQREDKRKIKPGQGVNWDNVPTCNILNLLQ